MSEPKVSIVIPVYNGSNFLRGAIESALRQSYRNIEVIVVNDGSTDGGATERVACSYGDSVRYFAQDNTGVAGALNTGLRAMRGDFFAWLSHDDLHLPEKTERQIAFLQKLGRPNACLYSDYNLMNEAGEIWHTARLDHADLMRRPLLALLRGMLNGCTVLIPAHVMFEFGLFDERLRYVQDYQLWNEIARKYDWYHQPEVLVSYRIHPGQDTHKSAAIREANELWIRIMDSRSELERTLLSGSSRNFFFGMVDFLAQTPYSKAMEYAQLRAESSVRDTLVSVIIPLHEEFTFPIRAAMSALSQTHQNVEVLLVHDGSSPSLAAGHALQKADARVRLLKGKKPGLAGSWNEGMAAALGHYVAFFDGQGLLAPEKINRQLSAMQKAGLLVSHTSYRVCADCDASSSTYISSGELSGKICAKSLKHARLSFTTMIVHSSVLRAGFEIAIGHGGGDLVGFIADLTSRYEVIGIDEPLCTFTLSPVPDDLLDVPGSARARDVVGAGYSISRPSQLIAEQLADGFSVQAAPNSDKMILSGAGFLETGTVVLPRSPPDGLRFTIASTALTISALRVAVAGGTATVVGENATLTPTTPQSYRYLAASDYWIRD